MMSNFAEKEPAIIGIIHKSSTTSKETKKVLELIEWLESLNIKIKKKLKKKDENQFINMKAITGFYTRYISFLNCKIQHRIINNIVKKTTLVTNFSHFLDLSLRCCRDVRPLDPSPSMQAL
jgi:hypothetical protein